MPYYYNLIGKQHYIQRWSSYTPNDFKYIGKIHYVLNYADLQKRIDDLNKYARRTGSSIKYKLNDIVIDYYYKTINKEVK